MSEKGLASKIEYQFGYGCLFCQTGKEKKIANELANAFTGIQIICPEKVMYIRLQQVVKQQAIIMFPGYLFFYAPSNFPVKMLTKKDGVYKLLENTEGEWKVSPQDQMLIEKFFEYNGMIGISRAFYEGGKIRPIDGLLKDYEGKILRVNRRNSKAQVAFEIGQRVINVWLGFEEME